MSKKYMSRPPYVGGAIPDYTTPPMTVEEYKYYEKEFFGFLEDSNDKPVEKQEEAEQPGIVSRFLQFIGFSKISKDEDEVAAAAFKCNVRDVDNETFNSRLSGTGDSVNDGASATVTKQVHVVKTESKATQTEDVVKFDQGVQTEKKSKRKFLKSCRRFFRRSCKCLKAEE